MLLPGDKLSLLLSILPILAYAETHYRFTGFPSRYFKREPEIIFDLPRRLEPGADLPVILLIKDADRYPISVESIEATIRQKQPSETIKFQLPVSKVTDYLFYQIFTIQNSQLPQGGFEINIAFKYASKGKIKKAQNDNHRGTRHKPFKVYHNSESWPKDNGWYAGDIHAHSDATDDFVEFGAPIEVYAKMGPPLGLSFMAITDHSYDIDDEPGKYYAPDLDLKRWKHLSKSISESNANPGFIIIQGEEISCGSKDSRNVHLLGLNMNRFIPGYGDSAESWFNNSPTSPIGQVAGEITGQGGLPVAAHPGEKPTFLEKLLLNRGPWTFDDCDSDDFHHLQILNGRRTDSFFAGIALWRKLLIEGHHKYVVAGSDAHGNLNRLRQIRMPFLNFRESDRQTFGCSRTLVYLGDTPPSAFSILEAIRRGNCIITDGPFINLFFKNSDSERRIPGDTIENMGTSDWQLNIELKTTEEFGPLGKMRIYYGDINKRKESMLIYEDAFPKTYHDHFESLNITNALNSNVLPGTHQKKDFRYDSGITPSPKLNGYIRAELTTVKGNICLTNPIWIKS